MIKQLLYKWFGLDPIQCETCEVLRSQLTESNRERRELLQKLLEKDKPEPLIQTATEELKPITPQYTPWRVRKQMLESEDRKTAQLTRDKQAEIEKLERELDIPLVVEK